MTSALPAMAASVFSRATVGVSQLLVQSPGSAVSPVAAFLMSSVIPLVPAFCVVGAGEDHRDAQLGGAGGEGEDEGDEETKVFHGELSKRAEEPDPSEYLRMTTARIIRLLQGFLLRRRCRG